MERYKPPHKIVIRAGQFYLTSFVDKNGNPRTAVNSPGFPERALCEAYGDQLRDEASAPVEEVEEVAEEDTGDQTVVPPTAEVTLDPQTPEATVEPDTTDTEGTSDGNQADSSDPSTAPVG